MAWENPYLKGLMSTQLEAIEPAAEPTGNRQQRRVPSNTSSKKKASLADGVFDLLKVTPHAIVASINDGADVWCNLSEESLVGKSSDILLKHGPTVAGKWAVLGILDALPDVPEMIGDINMTQINMATTVAGLGSLGAMVLTFAPMLRGILGRPNESYGITPLLIFRQVAVS